MYIPQYVCTYIIKSNQIRATIILYLTWTESHISTRNSEGLPFTDNPAPTPVHFQEGKYVSKKQDL